MSKNRILNILIFITVTVFIVMLSVYVYRFTNNSSLVVDVSSAKAPQAISLFVNNEQIYGFNETEGRFKITNISGEQEVVVKQAGYEDFTETVNIGWREEKIVVVQFTEISAEDIVSSLDDGKFSTPDQAFDIKYHENNTWITYKLPSQFENTVPDLVIAYYDTTDNAWVVVNYGQDNEFYVPSDQYEIPATVLEEISR